jgi:hypothetical protein
LVRPQKLGTLSAEQQAKLEQLYQDSFDFLQAAEQQDAAAEAPTLEEILFGFRRQQVGGLPAHEQAQLGMGRVHGAGSSHKWGEPL